VDMTEKLSRRALVSWLGRAAATGIAALPMVGCLSRQPGIPTKNESAAMGDIARAFIQRFSVPALSIAISRNGQMVYEEQFSLVEEYMPSASSLFRIASVTKPITSVAILSLIEKSKLNLTDRVFGPSGVLGTKYGAYPYPQYVTDITVDHLLTHTCGGWPNDSTDPMFRFGSSDQSQLISWTLENLPLSYPPGEHWAYSNFGYCLLGRVIEEVAGQSYADYVQKNILAACGISDMRISGNTNRPARTERGELYRAERRRSIRHERHAHGFARRLVGEPFRSCALPESCEWSRGEAAEAGNSPADDHPESGVSRFFSGKVRQGLVCEK
jgi:CubicO group peptidase (beta-lactamase class C family)